MPESFDGVCLGPLSEAGDLLTFEGPFPEVRRSLSDCPSVLNENVLIGVMLLFESRFASGLLAFGEAPFFESGLLLALGSTAFFGLGPPICFLCFGFETVSAAARRMVNVAAPATGSDTEPGRAASQDCLSFVMVTVAVRVGVTVDALHDVTGHWHHDDLSVSLRLSAAGDS